MTSVMGQLRSQLGRFPADTHPVEHAAIRFNLGLAIAEDPIGERMSNLERAIPEYAAALAGFGADRQPRERARVLTALGAAEHDLGLAVQARDRFAEALDLLDPNRWPGEAGAAGNGLGLALLAAGDRDAAIKAYRDALGVFGSGYGRQRATCLHNLGLALALGGTVEDLGAACSAYEEAISLLEDQEATYVIAAIHNALGNALMDLPSERPARLQRAIRCFDVALGVFTRRNHPFQHALAKNNLGVAFEELAGHDPTMLRRALVALEDAVGLFDFRIHREQSEHARANLERVRLKLDEQFPGQTRWAHFAALLAAVSPPERRALLRSRVALAYAAEPGDVAHALDQAIVRLDDGEMSEATQAWLIVLMEQPHELLERALKSRQASHRDLDAERLQAARAALEDGMGQLEIIQRVRVRDMLTELGYERPESR